MALKKPISDELFKLLACPTDKAELTYNKNNSALVCMKCKALYPIKEGIPVLLPQKKK